MSIIRPIVRSVVRSVASSILGDVVTRFFSIFGGDKNIVLGQVLFPATSDFTLRVKIRPSEADVGANTTILSQDVIATPRILTSGTDVLRIIYTNLSAGSVTLNSTTPIQAGVDMDVELVSSATTGTTLKINGVPEDGSAGIVDPTVFGIDLFGVRHDDAFFFQGEIYDGVIPNGAGVSTYPINEATGLVAADNSFVGAFDQLPRSEWVEGNGVDIFGSFSPVTLAGDFVIEWEEVRGDSLAGNSQTASLGLASNGDTRVYIFDSGATFPDRVQFGIAGIGNNSFNTALVGVSVGDNYSGKLTRVSGSVSLDINNTFIGSDSGSGSVTFDQLMQTGTGNQKTSPQGIHRITDSSGNTYEWRLNEVIDIGGGQGLVKNTGSVPQFGVEEFVGQPNSLVDAGWGIAVDTGTRTASGSSEWRRSPVEPMNEGDIYRVTIRKSGVWTSNINIQAGGAGASVLVVGLGAADGEHTGYTVAGSSSITDLRIFSSSATGSVEVIECKKTTDLLLNNWEPADQTLVTVPTDGIWTAEPVRVKR